MPESVGRACRVWVVDDEPGILEVATIALQLRGYDVVPCLGAQAALDLLSTSGPPDLVVLDLVMPGLSGQALFRRLRSVSDVAVLFHSGFRGVDSLAEELQEPRTAFLQKPWTLNALYAGVESLLRQKPVGTS